MIRIANHNQVSVGVACGDRGVVFRLDEVLDAVGSRSCLIGVEDVHIIAFLELPLQPTVQRAVVLEARIADHQHPDRCVVQVGVVSVNVRDGSAVEQLRIDWLESWAVGFQQHILGDLGIGTVEVYGDLDVVEHADLVAHGIVAHRLDGHCAELYTTHGAFHADDGLGLTV